MALAELIIISTSPFPGYLQERPFIIRRIQRTQTTKNCFHVWLWEKKYTDYFSWQAQRVKITQRHWGARLRNNNNTSNNNNSNNNNNKKTIFCIWKKTLCQDCIFPSLSPAAKPEINPALTLDRFVGCWKLPCCSSPSTGSSWFAF